MELDYARAKAIFRRVLIVSSSPADTLAEAGNNPRFLRFEHALNSAGFAAAYRAVDCISRLLEIISSFTPDIVFCAADHLPATNAAGALSVNVHEWFESEGIPFAGSASEAIDLALSKSALKRRWNRDGIPTPPFVEIDRSTDLAAMADSEFPAYPCIVKPSGAGNSRGIGRHSVVTDRVSLNDRSSRLLEEYGQVLIEHYLGSYPDFREITCACIGNGEGRICMPSELVFIDKPELHVITTADKNNNKISVRAIEDPGLRSNAAVLAEKAFASAGVRDYARCDMAFADGMFWVIEINGQPMIPDTWFGACTAHAGLSEHQYLIAIMTAAIRREAGIRGMEAVLPSAALSMLPEWLEARL